MEGDAMKRTHLILKTSTIAGLMLAITAVGVLALIAIAVFGGGEFSTTDATAELTIHRDAMAVPRDTDIAHLFLTEVRGSTTAEHSASGETGQCPQLDAQSDNLWEARAQVRCFRGLDRSRGEDR